MILATLGYAIGPLIVQRHLADLDSLGPIAASVGIASVLLLPLAALNLPERWPSPTVPASVVVLGAVCTALAMLVMFYLVRQAGAARASLIAYLNPAVATLLGVLALRERLEVGGALAFALILFGSWLATRGRRDTDAW